MNILASYPKRSAPLGQLNELYPTKQGLQAKGKKYRMGMKKQFDKRHGATKEPLEDDVGRFEEERNSREETTKGQILEPDR